MTGIEMAFLIVVVSAMAIFALGLNWASRVASSAALEKARKP